MDGFQFMNKRDGEKKKLIRTGSILAWTALILIWALLAARSIVVIG